MNGLLDGCKGMRTTNTFFLFFFFFCSKIGFYRDDNGQ